MELVQEWKRRADETLTHAERRQLRRTGVRSASIAALLTVALVSLALTRVRDRPAPTATAIQVLGATATSTVAPTTTTPATTTTKPKPKPKPKPTTTTLPPLPPLPPVFTGWPTTTIPPSTTTAAPPTTVPAAPRIVWSANPSSATVQSGGIVAVTVTAANFGTAPGLVSVPTCPGAPRPMAVQPRASVCAQGSRVVSVDPGQLQTWTVSLQATSDGTRLGKPLAAGRYRVTVGGTSVALNVVR